MPMATPQEQRRYQRERAARLRAEWLKANGPCKHSGCGSWLRLEVDHIDRSTKDSRLKKGTGLWSWSVANRKAELSKCQVLCHEHHKQKTKSELVKPVIHGTANAYKSSKCRCLQCKDATLEYQRQWRALSPKSDRPHIGSAAA